jgi:Zn-dependent M28 family amino/carboxypeptidase
VAVAPVPPAERAFVRPRPRALAALAAWAALLVIGAGALLDVRPPSAAGASAPADRFSAERAHAVQEQVARGIHPAGSAANDAVRRYLVDALEALGLETSVQDAVGPKAGQLSGAAGGATMARVRNVVARLPGTDPTGRVFLVAHYDSVQVGPGGNDDAAGVAAIVEVARALAAGPAPRNDIVFVLTDAEEACLCGAAAFASAHPLAADGGVVLNLEARGRTGPVVMFATSPDNAALVAAFGRHAPHPVGTSFAVEVYRLLPNDTDFTAFLDAGFVGLNAAYIDGGAIYHTPLDTAGAADRRSLQHHGDNALALARGFGAADLTAVDASGDATYFPVPGGLARYPGWLTWVVAALALAAVAAVAVAARRRGRVTWRRVAAGFGLALVPILAAPALAKLLWTAVTAIRPGYAGLLDPYRPLLWRLAVLALSAAVLFVWYALLRRRMGPAALAIGGLLWLALFGLALAAFAPGGSYLAALPALATAVAALAALWLRGWWAVLALTAGAAVAVVILAPTVSLLFPALGMATGGAAALFAVWLGLAVLPLVDLLFPEAGGQRGLDALRASRRGALPGLAALVAAVVFVGTAFAVDRFDARHPIPTHLMYAMDAGTGQARWLSEESTLQDWTSSYVDAKGSVYAEFPALDDEELWTGPAGPAPLPAPDLTVLSDTAAGSTRTLRLRLTPRRTPVRLVSLHVDGATATVERAVVAGRPVSAEEGALDDRWSFGLVFHAPPPEGIEVELVLRPTGGGQVRVRAMDASDGLAGLPGFRPRPPDVGVAGSHSAEMAAVARTYAL